MKTVYAISSGSYSDYSVHAIFERREDAEKFNEDKWYDIGEMAFYAEGEQPEEVVWYEGSMSVNDKYPQISQRKALPWEYEADRSKFDRPRIVFRGWDRVPAFFGECNDKTLLSRAIHEKTVKYRAELDQLLRDVHGALVKLSGEKTRPVMIAEIAAVLGRETEDVAYAVQELKNAGVLDDAEPKREIKREEIEPPEPTEGKAVRIPIVRTRARPPKPSEGE